MHAAVVRVKIAGGVTDARLANLKEKIVPTISAAPGFVAGYWLDQVDDQGLAIVVFEDEASAKAAAPPVGADMGEGVTVDSTEFREVLAHA